MSVEEKLAMHLSNSNTVPFLFVGSGFSRRYLGLEDWEGLLKRFAELTDKPYEYYFSNASGDFKKIASLIAEEFNPIWWNSEKYIESRSNYKKEILNPCSPLKIEISKYLKEKSLKLDDDINKRAEIEYLKKVCIDGIITTNWDTLLEQIFPNFQKYIGQKELLFNNPLEIAEIYKIHGCCTLPNSLVLTDEDYSNFDKHNPYLAAKLITIFIEHPVIFIGYSLRDENILKILRSITSCLTEDNIYKLKNNLIFVHWDSECRENTMEDTIITTGDFTLPITVINVDNFVPVFKVLTSLKRQFGARVIRQLKTQIYELVKVNSIKNRVYVLDINDNTNFDKVDIVCGIGVSDKLSLKGYESITPTELYEDIIVDDRKFNYDEITMKTLPQVLKVDHFVPMYKYLYGSKYKIGDIKKIVTRRVIKDYNQLICQTIKDKMQTVQSKYSSVKEVIDSNPMDKCMEIIPALGEKNIDIKLLEKFINDFYKQNKQLLYGPASVLKSNFRRVIRIYDWLRYGRIWLQK